MKCKKRKPKNLNITGFEISDGSLITVNTNVKVAHSYKHFRD